MMRRQSLVLTAAAVAMTLTVVPYAQTPRSSGGPVNSFYDLKMMTLTGKPADLGMYRGKVSFVVNVASKCGFTPQYEGLESLQREMKGQAFNVLGFP